MQQAEKRPLWFHSHWFLIATVSWNICNWAVFEVVIVIPAKSARVLQCCRRLCSHWSKCESLTCTKKNRSLRPGEICPLVSDRRYLVPKIQRRVTGICLCGSHRDAWRRRCAGEGVLCSWSSLVIYSEFKGHLTNIATTAFWSTVSCHLVHQVTRTLQSHDLNTTETAWDEFCHDSHDESQGRLDQSTDTLTGRQMKRKQFYLGQNNNMITLSRSSRETRGRGQCPNGGQKHSGETVRGEQSKSKVGK